MAKILHDFKLRSSSEIRSTTGGNLLRDGADEFKKMLEEVDGGVLFIDEVNQLDRLGSARVRMQVFTTAPLPLPHRCTSSIRRTTRTAPTS